MTFNTTTYVILLIAIFLFPACMVAAQKTENVLVDVLNMSGNEEYILYPGQEYVIRVNVENVESDYISMINVTMYSFPKDEGSASILPSCLHLFWDQGNGFYELGDQGALISGDSSSNISSENEGQWNFALMMPNWSVAGPWRVDVEIIPSGITSSILTEVQCKSKITSAGYSELSGEPGDWTGILAPIELLISSNTDVNINFSSTGLVNQQGKLAVGPEYVQLDDDPLLAEQTETGRNPFKLDKAKQAFLSCGANINQIVSIYPHVLLPNPLLDSGYLEGSIEASIIHSTNTVDKFKPNITEMKISSYGQNNLEAKSGMVTITGQVFDDSLVSSLVFSITLSGRGAQIKQKCWCGNGSQYANFDLNITEGDNIKYSIEATDICGRITNVTDSVVVTSSDERIKGVYVGNHSLWENDPTDIFPSFPSNGFVCIYAEILDTEGAVTHFEKRFADSSFVFDAGKIQMANLESTDWPNFWSSSIDVAPGENVTYWVTTEEGWISEKKWFKAYPDEWYNHYGFGMHKLLGTPLYDITNWKKLMDEVGASYLFCRLISHRQSSPLNLPFNDSKGLEHWKVGYTHASSGITDIGEGYRPRDHLNLIRRTFESTDPYGKFYRYAWGAHDSLWEDQSMPTLTYEAQVISLIEKWAREYAAKDPYFIGWLQDGEYDHDWATGSVVDARQFVVDEDGTVWHGGQEEFNDTWTGEYHPAIGANWTLNHAFINYKADRNYGNNDGICSFKEYQFTIYKLITETFRDYRKDLWWGLYPGYGVYWDLNLLRDIGESTYKHGKAINHLNPRAGGDTYLQKLDPNIHTSGQNMHQGISWGQPDLGTEICLHQTWQFGSNAENGSRGWGYSIPHHEGTHYSGPAYTWATGFAEQATAAWLMNARFVTAGQDNWDRKNDDLTGLDDEEASYLSRILGIVNPIPYISNLIWTDSSDQYDVTKGTKPTWFSYDNPALSYSLMKEKGSMYQLMIANIDLSWGSCQPQEVFITLGEDLFDKMNTDYIVFFNATDGRDWNTITRENNTISLTIPSWDTNKDGKGDGALAVYKFGVPFEILTLPTKGDGYSRQIESGSELFIKNYDPLASELRLWISSSITNYIKVYYSEGSAIPTLWINGELAQTVPYTGLDGPQTVIARIPGATGPLVTLKHPRGGEIVSEETQVAWWAADPQGQDIDITIDIKPSIISSWQMVARRIPNNGSIVVDTTKYPNSNQTIIRMTANSNNQSSHVYSGEFRILNSNIMDEPYIEMIFPANGSLIRPDMIINFQIIGASSVTYDWDGGKRINLSYPYDVSGNMPASGLHSLNLYLRGVNTTCHKKFLFNIDGNISMPAIYALAHRKGDGGYGLLTLPYSTPDWTYAAAMTQIISEGYLADLPNTINYLSSSRGADGLWGSTNIPYGGLEERVRLTYEITKLLRDLGVTMDWSPTKNFLDQAQKSDSSWTNQPGYFGFDSILATAYAVLLYDSIGEPVPRIGEVAEVLLSYRNPDGGFDNTNAALSRKDLGSGSIGNQSNVIFTYVILDALFKMDIELENIQATTSFIKSCQNPDGGFGYFPNTSSDIFASWAAISALDILDQLPEDSAAAIGYLKQCQNPNGGFGARPYRASTLYDTYYALNCLHLLGSMVPKNEDQPVQEPIIPNHLRAYVLISEWPGFDSPGFSVEYAGAVGVDLIAPKNSAFTYLQQMETYADSHGYDVKIARGTEDYSAKTGWPGLGCFTHISHIISEIEDDLNLRVEDFWPGFKAKSIIPNHLTGALYQEWPAGYSGLFAFEDSISSSEGYDTLDVIQKYGGDYLRIFPRFGARYVQEMPCTSNLDAHKSIWHMRDDTQKMRTVFLATNGTYDGFREAVQNGWVIAVLLDDDGRPILYGPQTILGEFKIRQEEFDWWTLKKDLKIMVHTISPSNSYDYDYRNPNDNSTWNKTNGAVIRVYSDNVISSASLDGETIDLSYAENDETRKASYYWYVGKDILPGNHTLQIDYLEGGASKTHELTITC